MSCRLRLHAFEHRKGSFRQTQQLGLFLSKGFANAQSTLIWTSPICRDTIAPGFGLSIQIFQIDELAGSEKALTCESDGPFDPALFVAPGHGHGAWLVAIVPSEL